MTDLHVETDHLSANGIVEAAAVLPGDFTAQRLKADLIDAAFLALKNYIHPQGVGMKMLDPKSGQMVPKHIYSKSRLAKYRQGRMSHRQFHRDKFGRKTVAANESGDLRYYVSFPIVWLLYLDNDPPGHAEHRRTGRPYTPEELKEAELTRQWLKKQVSKYVFEAADGRLYLKCRLDLTQPLPPKLFQDLAKALNAANPYKSTIEIKGTPRSQKSAGCLARLPVFGTIAKVEEFKAVPEVNAGWLVGWIGTLEEMTPEVKVEKVLEASCDFGDLDLAPEADRFYAHAQFPKRVGELRITENDNQVWVGIQKWIAENPNDQDTNPYTRTKYLWNLMYEQGKAEHKFNYERYKAIRDFYSDHGLIEWTDCRHYPGVGYEGVACKWYLKDLEEEREDNITVQGVHVRPIRVTPYEYHSEPALTVSPRQTSQEWWEWATEELETTFSA